MSFFEKIRGGLQKTASSITAAFQGHTELDDDFYEELEERLILSDMGVEAVMEAVDALKDAVRLKKIKTTDDAKTELRLILTDMLSVGSTELSLSGKPAVILVVGVNGVGKTTSIGKLASRFCEQGKSVLLCAADTFRAAAADQLEIWAQRTGCQIVRQDEGADPASVVYDAISAGKSRNADVILCDTAGRLHNKANLMQELEKIRRVIRRELPQTEIETLLVLDAATGQNGLAQAKQFREIVGVSGIVLTKLDGTAKGGIVLAIAKELQIPVKFIGVGEKVDDLMPFDRQAFVEAIL